MNPEQALQFLKGALVLAPGINLDTAAAVVQAWNIVAQALQPKPAGMDKPTPEQLAEAEKKRGL